MTELEKLEAKLAATNNRLEEVKTRTAKRVKAVKDKIAAIKAEIAAL